MGSIPNAYIFQAQKLIIEHNELYNVLSSFQSFKLSKIKFDKWLVLVYCTCSSFKKNYNWLTT